MSRPVPAPNGSTGRWGDRPLAVLALFLIGALVGGSSLRLLLVVVRPEGVAAAGLVALCVGGLTLLGLRAGGRPTTPYW